MEDIVNYIHSLYTYRMDDIIPAKYDSLAHWYSFMHWGKNPYYEQEGNPLTQEYVTVALVVMMCCFVVRWFYQVTIVNVC